MDGCKGNELPPLYALAICLHTCGLTDDQIAWSLSLDRAVVPHVLHLARLKAERLRAQRSSLSEVATDTGAEHVHPQFTPEIGARPSEILDRWPLTIADE